MSPEDQATLDMIASSPADPLTGGEMIKVLILMILIVTVVLYRITHPDEFE